MAEGFAQQQQEVQPTDNLVEKSPNAFGADNYNIQHWGELLKWDPLDPGLYQRQYSDNEMEQDLVDFDGEPEDQSPLQNNFINEQARDYDYGNGSSSDIRE